MQVSGTNVVEVGVEFKLKLCRGGARAVVVSPKV